MKGILSAPTPSAPPALRHGLVGVGAALAVVLAGGGLLWGSAVREGLALLRGARPPAAPDAAPAEVQTVQVRLAFLGADGRTLEEEPRELTLNLSAPGAARAILEALRAGSHQGRGAVLAPAVQVRHIFVDTRGVAYVDLSAEVLRPAGPRPAEPVGPGGGAAPGASAGGAEGRTPATPEGAAPVAKAPGEEEARPSVVLVAQAIAATLGMSLPEIAQVQILVEGHEVPVVTEKVDLRRPLPASLPIHSPGPSP
ncbi:MAG TPA: GerMN domain-containing protein [Candidatus Methylomirabilis sp.]